MVCSTGTSITALIAFAELGPQPIWGSQEKGPMTFCYQVFHAFLEIHSTSFCNAHCLFQGFLRHKAGKRSLWKRGHCLTAGTPCWIELPALPEGWRPTAWRCCAAPSGAYHTFAESHLSHAQRKAWPRAAGSRYNPLNIPLAAPGNGEAEVARWTLQGQETRQLVHGPLRWERSATKPGRSCSPFIQTSCWGAIGFLQGDTVVYCGGEPLADTLPDCSWGNVMVKIRLSPTGRYSYCQQVVV